MFVLFILHQSCLTIIAGNTAYTIYSVYYIQRCGKLVREKGERGDGGRGIDAE